MMKRLITLLLITASLAAHAATSVTIRDVTFNFDADETVGQYANGDYYVVGPVSITSITPASANVGGWIKNGTMVNPQTRLTQQGFDNSMSEYVLGPSYNNANNVDPGNTGVDLDVTTGTVVKSISKANTPDDRSGGDLWPQLQDMEYLTVVSMEPAANSFRPPPVGTDKTSYWTTADLDYGILKSYTVLSGAPTLGSAVGWTDQPWPSFMWDVQGRMIKAEDNMPDYGRDFGRRIGNAGLVLHSDVGDKTTLMIQMVQIGIDVYGTVNDATVFPGDGAINVGWKWPMLLAGLALDDAGILALVSGGESTAGLAPDNDDLNFAFDRQTWYVLESDVGRPLYSGDGKTRVEYGPEHVGLPEWGEKHWYDPYPSLIIKDGSNWGVSYRQIAFTGAFSGILSAILTTGGEAAWGWPATIEYFDRFMADFPLGISDPPGGNKLTDWEHDMYTTYRFEEDDMTGPVISSLSSGTPTSSMAAVSWTTDEPSTTVVDYGLTASYGSQVSDATLVSNHSALLGSLTAETTYHWRATSVDGFGNPTSSADQTFVTDEAGADPAAAPTFDPEVTLHAESVTVTISKTTGTDIRYTTDGSTPTTGSTLYSSPLFFSANTTLKAYVPADGTYLDSQVTTFSYRIADWLIDSAWNEVALEETYTSDTVNVQVVVDRPDDGGDMIIGIAPDADVDDYTDLACIVGFRSLGLVEARDGGAYDAETTLNYESHGANTFTIDFEINLSAKTYDATVTPLGDSPYVIADDYDFRTEQSAAAQLSTLAAIDAATPETGGVISLESFNPGITPVVRKFRFGQGIEDL